MPKFMFIAEKPSLMRDVQACYRKHKDEIVQKVGQMDFIALAGHVCTNFEPGDYEEWKDKKWYEVDYPMVPKQWGVKPISDSYKLKTIQKIKELIGNYDGIIVGTDSDVEGYGIYYLLETYLGLQNKFALRFIEHSLTDKEILKSLLSMTDYHSDPTHVHFTQSFLLRSRADSLYGFNASRMVSVKMSTLMRVGRVKAPTIKLVYDNSMTIADFRSQVSYQIQADYLDFKSILIDDNKTPRSFKTREDAAKLKFPLIGEIIDKTVERKSKDPEKLYDLTAIQAEAGKRFGYKPDQTLEIIQSLYEKHKVISYPRTQCRYVSVEKSKEFPMMLDHMSAFPELAPYVKNISNEDIHRVMRSSRVVNDREVQKESHDALLPTSNRPDPNTMTEKEYNICLMIFGRLLEQFMPKFETDDTTLIIQHGDGKFVAKGSTVVNQGWRALFRKKEDASLPVFDEGDKVHAASIGPVERKTSPPKRLTQASLIAAMKNIASQIDDPQLKKSLQDSQGIGTPATRAAIIKDIITTGYVEDKKDGLYITDLGKSYVESIKTLDIIRPDFAAVMDTEIKKIQRGEARYDVIYAKVTTDLKTMCGQIEAMPAVVQSEKIREMCPSCHNPLYAERYNYVCHNCDFKVPKTICSIPISEGQLGSLLKGNILPAKQFTRKDGKKFTARLKLDEQYKIAFDFSSGYSCPLCGKPLFANNGGMFCRNEDCGLKIFKNSFGHMLTDREMKDLVTKKKTNPIGFVSKKTGKKYEACICIDDEKKEVGLEFNNNSGGKSSGYNCPLCGKPLFANNGGLFCRNEACGLRIFKNSFGHTLTDEEMKMLVTKGKTKKMTLVNKVGKEYEAFLYIDPDNKEVKVDFPKKK